METEPSAAGADETELTAEERALVWVRLVSEAIMLVYIVDLVFHLEIVDDATRYVRKWTTKVEWNRRFRIAANHVVFEAMQVLEEAKQR